MHLGQNYYYSGSVRTEERRDVSSKVPQWLVKVNQSGYEFAFQAHELACDSQFARRSHLVARTVTRLNQLALAANGGESDVCAYRPSSTAVASVGVRALPTRGRQRCTSA
jgi:hypothetical protein